MTATEHSHEHTLEGVFETPRNSRVQREFRRASVDPSNVRPGDLTLAVAQPDDRILLFTPVITATRLLTTAICVISASVELQTRSTGLVFVGVLIIVYNAIRAFRPIRYTSDIASMARVVTELGVHVLAVAGTGAWRSPFAFCLITPVIVAGFSRGFAFSIRISTTAVIAISIAHLSRDFTTDAVQTCASWGSIIFVIALVSGYGRRVSGAADRERSIALDRLGRLADANALLYSLHRVAQTLPASLDMAEVLDSTTARLRGLIDFDAMAILIFDETDGSWQVIRCEGTRLPARLSSDELPDGLHQAILESRVVSVDQLFGTGGGLSSNSRSGLYATLTTRGAVMGLIALEHRSPHKFDHRSIGLLSGFVPPLALAMDNARWFARLRTVGADEERTRIARDIHDRIGQSLAYLAFEMDRIVRNTPEDDPGRMALDHFRGDIRTVIGEVRDTLYDLRTDVSETTGFVETMQAYIERVSDRTELDIVLRTEGHERLPFLQEREMWRIAQEAITNIERHANATHVTVLWRTEDGKAALRVIDNGIGFEIGKSGRLDSYGLLGMRERAASIGATLEIDSRVGHGTTVTCVVDPSRSTIRP